MKRTIPVVATLTGALAALAFGALGSVYAMNVLINEGQWPKTWPKQLEPLRKQARTARGGAADTTSYDIPFTKREQFEAAWPHILAVKTKGAPVILVRGPDVWPGSKSYDAGVRIHCPPGQIGEPVAPAGPLPGQSDPRISWLRTNFIELFVDGDIVDLKRISLPADTPLIDERFKGVMGGQNKARERRGG